MYAEGVEIKPLGLAQESLVLP